MIELYNEVCEACSRLTTERYSTSFSMGIRAFAKKFRSPIYNVYGYVRFADEIVDSFHGHDKQDLLEKFWRDTQDAIKNKISLNPILHTFQKTFHEYDLDLEHVRAFLDSMEMDLDEQVYDQELYKKYIYGSAEVVGLMCLKVFCEGDSKAYNELEPYARALGSAFQKINFLRDIKSDYEDRGRVYFPNVSYNNFSESCKKTIEADIQKDFDYALVGIKQLPKGSRLGVYLAYKYYINLFKKIRNSPAVQVQQKRIRVRNRRKVYLLATSTVKNSLNLI